MYIMPSKIYRDLPNRGTGHNSKVKSDTIPARCAVGVQWCVVRPVDPLYNSVRNQFEIQNRLSGHVQCPTVGALNAHCTPTAFRAGIE